eukprot:gene10498-4916_t
MGYVFPFALYPPGGTKEGPGAMPMAWAVVAGPDRGLEEERILFKAHVIDLVFEVQPCDSSIFLAVAALAAGAAAAAAAKIFRATDLKVAKQNWDSDSDSDWENACEAADDDEDAGGAKGGGEEEEAEPETLAARQMA